MQQPKKIVILGPESTGKSTLCTQLAAHYHTKWVPEYAREYLLANGKEYTYEDLGRIAKEQVIKEEMAMADLQWNIYNKKPYLFIDTNLYVIKVWSEFVFNKCDNRVLTQIAERAYDLYLLCYIDLPWIQDELREYPDLLSREKLFHHYKDAMINQSVPWVQISGTYEERLLMGIKAVDTYL